jgi:hypothetical protein
MLRPGRDPARCPDKGRYVKEQKGNGMHEGARKRASKVDKSDKISPISRAQGNADDDKSAPKSGRRRRQQMASEGGQMSKLTGIALKCAQLVPSAMFASPAAVVRSKALSLPQKIAILRRWEFDVRQRSEASRALAVGVEVGLLEEVRVALADLGAPADPSEIRPLRVPVAAH